jgi:hypothetical protein
MVRGVHELGHGHGFGRDPTDVNDHFNNPAICPTPVASSDQTMCAAYATGAKWWRTLESHDESVFDARY